MNLELPTILLIGIEVVLVIVGIKCFLPRRAQETSRSSNSYRRPGRNDSSTSYADSNDVSSAHDSCSSDSGSSCGGDGGD